MADTQINQTNPPPPPPPPRNGRGGTGLILGALVVIVLLIVLWFTGVLGDRDAAQEFDTDVNIEAPDVEAPDVDMPDADVPGTQDADGPEGELDAPGRE